MAYLINNKLFLSKTEYDKLGKAIKSFSHDRDKLKTAVLEFLPENLVSRVFDGAYSYL